MISQDGDDGFIEVPGITKSPLAFLESARIGLPKLQAPAPYRFVGDHDSTFSQQFFDLSEVEAKAMIEPDGMTADGRRESVALVAVGFVVMPSSLPNMSYGDNAL